MEFEGTTSSDILICKESVNHKTKITIVENYSQVIFKTLCSKRSGEKPEHFSMLCNQIECGAECVHLSSLLGVLRRVQRRQNAGLWKTGRSIGQTSEPLTAPQMHLRSRVNLVMLGK